VKGRVAKGKSKYTRTPREKEKMGVQKRSVPRLGLKAEGTGKWKKMIHRLGRKKIRGLKALKVGTFQIWSCLGGLWKTESRTSKIKGPAGGTAKGKGKRECMYAFEV